MRGTKVKGQSIEIYIDKLHRKNTCEGGKIVLIIHYKSELLDKSFDNTSKTTCRQPK